MTMRRVLRAPMQGDAGKRREANAAHKRAEKCVHRKERGNRQLKVQKTSTAVRSLFDGSMRKDCQ